MNYLACILKFSIFIIAVFMYSSCKEQSENERNLTTEVSKIETNYQKGDIKNEEPLPIEKRCPESNASESYILEIKKKLNDSYSKQTTYLKSGGNTVGVIKNGSCGPYQELMIFMDCEDGGSSTTNGWVGDCTVDSNMNITLRFCVVNLAYFKGTYFEYAILNLTATSSWPYGVSKIERHFDNEDYKNANYCTLNGIEYSGDLGDCSFYNNTDLGFYYYKPQLEYNAFPNLGISYGVLGNFYSTKGYIFFDDENYHNANVYQEASFNFNTNTLDIPNEHITNSFFFNYSDANTKMQVMKVY